MHGPVSVDELKGQERPIARSSLYPPENIKMAFLFFFFFYLYLCVCAISQEGDKDSFSDCHVPFTIG